MDSKLKLLNAIRKNELIDYLEGIGEYKLELHQWIGANVPTDVTQVISNGIYKVYLEHPELYVDKLFEYALLEMMDKDVFDLYCALLLIHMQLIEESYNSAPFNLNREKVITKLRKALQKNKENMCNYFEWDGKGQKDGVWTEVMRIDGLCKKKWEFSIIEG